MLYNQDNIFAKILKGEVPSDKLIENDFFLAFKDKFPQAPIHVLVIPKGLYMDIFHFNTKASTQEIEGFYRGVAKTIEFLELTSKGCRVISNMGEHGQQEVMHFHVHILAGKKLGSKIVGS